MRKGPGSQGEEPSPGPVAEVHWIGGFRYMTGGIVAIVIMATRRRRRRRRRRYQAAPAETVHVCVTCGTLHPVFARFCGKCGRRLR